MNNFKIAELIKRRPNIAALITCALGVMLNMLLNTLVNALELPLYLDTVGTVAVAAVCGYLPGVVTGAATNILRSLSDPSSLCYGVVSILTALSAAYITGRNREKKIRCMIEMVIAFTFISGVLGSLISWFMNGFSADGDTLRAAVFKTGLFSPFVSHIVSGVLIELPDKAFTVILAFSAVSFIPEKYYRFSDFNMWRQNPTAYEDVRSEKGSVRTVSLRTKVLVVLVFSLGIVAVLSTVLSARMFSKMLIKEHIRLADGTASLAAKLIDADHVDEYLRTGGNSKEYRETKALLTKILSDSPEIKYLYAYKIEEDGCHVVFDIDAEGDEAGAVIPFDESFTDLIPDLLLGKEIDPVIHNDRYGYLMTAYRPVYDSDGRCVCYTGADVDVKKLNEYGISFLTEMISVFLGAFILLIVFIDWLAEYHLIIPINSIAGSLDKLSHSSGTQEGMDADVKFFRSLSIRTGDEIENLYISACSLTKSQAEQMRNVRRLSDSTAKMQDGLIITMADLVESRDSDTGAHVQKTAAYVKIIAEGLKRKGYYPQKITPKFISDVVRSAPLHDIGKINVPDEVLNKPGKLSDREYEIMKTHAAAGKRIMENAISTVEGDNYLKEARNMAAYHHERWDGKGYPEGIHGEVIPLSARIMAVADVFDALISPRVYKPAFPLEKALAILEEGKGTQFDPKCVEVFMEALPEVKIILSKYNEK
ncbi:MAG: HD domain-containing protein [Lachnospiraceae bacterium]|nr:HD domain-containing protein [Lachnospiraceae bacterium]